MHCPAKMDFFPRISSLCSAASQETCTFFSDFRPLCVVFALFAPIAIFPLASFFYV